MDINSQMNYNNNNHHPSKQMNMLILLGIIYKIIMKIFNQEYKMINPKQNIQKIIIQLLTFWIKIKQIFKKDKSKDTLNLFKISFSHRAVYSQIK